MKFFQFFNLLVAMLAVHKSAAEEFTVTTIVKSFDVSQCSKQESATSNSQSCSNEKTTLNEAANSPDLSGRLAALENIFQTNRVTLCGAGMQDYRISDSQISSSDFHNSQTNDVHSHIYGRLLMKAGGAQAWCAKNEDPEKWIQIDLKKPTKIFGVTTQGRVTFDQWVTLYEVQYRLTSEEEFVPVVDDSNDTMIFPGNFDRQTPRVGEFPHPIQARFVRLKVLEFHGHPSLRWDLLLC